MGCLCEDLGKIHCVIMVLQCTVVRSSIWIMMIIKMMYLTAGGGGSFGMQVFVIVVIIFKDYQCYYRRCTAWFMFSTKHWLNSLANKNWVKYIGFLYRSSTLKYHKHRYINFICKKHNNMLALTLMMPYGILTWVNFASDNQWLLTCSPTNNYQKQSSHGVSLAQMNKFSGI